MANNRIQIKRSAATSSPTTLNPGELAFSNVTGGSGVLFIGSTDGATVVPIAGVRNPGTLTANQALVANSTSGINQIITSNVTLQYLSANGSYGTAGYFLASGGTSTNVYWISAGSVGVNVNAQYAWTNTQSYSNTITFNGWIQSTNAISANGSNGTSGYVLASGGNGNVYWVAPASLSLNTSAQYTWSNTQTFQNTITFSTSILANTVNAASYTVGTWGGAANAFIANSSFVGWGNTTANVQIAWDSTGQDLLAIGGNLNNYVEAAIWNSNTGVSASADFSINDNNGLYSNNYIDIGINGSNWSNTLWTINGPSDGYVYTGNTNLSIGTAAASYINFFTNGTLAGNERMRITSGGNVGINNTAPTNQLSVNGSTYLGGTVNVSANVVGVNAYFTNINASANIYATTVYANVTGTYANITGQVNTATFYAATSANVGAYFTVNSTAISAAVNTTVSSTNLYINTTNTAFTSNTTLGGTNTSITSNVQVSGTNTYISSNVTITGANIDATSSTLRVRDITASGNLIVTGSVVTVNTTTLQVNDNVIEIGFNNGGLSTDLIDTGIYSPSNTGGSVIYSGVARIAASSNTTVPWYKIFNTATNPNSGLTIVSSTTGALQAYLYPYGLGGAFVANTTVVNITANGTLSATITANTLTLTTNLATTSGGTGQNAYSSGDLLVGNTANALTRLGIGTDGYVLQVNGTTVSWNTLDGGTF